MGTISDDPWLITEGIASKYKGREQLELQLQKTKDVNIRALPTPPTLAMRFRDFIIHDVKSLFGGSDIRIDALVFHGNGRAGDLQSFYMPKTFRFSSIKDGEQLISEDENLLFYYGQPLFFVAIAVTVSKDQTRENELSDLLVEGLQTPDAKAAVGSVLGLAMTEPTAAIVAAAVDAAITLGKFAYRIISRATGKTIGYYHTSWLQSDRFGVGRHPPDRTYYTKGDISLSYEIIDDTQ